MNFWQTLDKPIFALAPMEEVTDTAFREMFARYGKPSVLYTEFVNVDGLMHPEGRKRLALDLAYSPAQRPIVAQIWGSDPEKFQQAAEYVASLGFDGIDINMGCPQSKEIKSGACSALIRTPELAREIVMATKKGAGNVPVSVKTRLGYSKLNEMDYWVKTVLETDPAELTLHARTKQEMSKVPAHWDKLAEAVDIRNRENPNVILLGNGDIRSREEGLQRIKETGVDGVMVGRGAFGNPWFFRVFEGTNPQGVLPSTVAGAPASFLQGVASHEVNSMAGDHCQIPSVEERMRVMLEHAELFERTYPNIKSFFIMRKHFKAYCSGFHGAAELRAKLMETHNLEETKKVVAEYFSTNDQLPVAESISSRIFRQMADRDLT